jgi:hypothetical protein
MLRTVLAAAAVILVFGATLVVGGEKLGAWDSPAPRATAKVEAPRARPARRPTRKRARPAWIAELNALCRGAEASVAAMPQPRTLPEVREHLRRLAGLSRRWNRQASTGPLAKAARYDAQSVRRLRELFAEERSVIQDASTAIARGDLEAFDRLGPLMITNGQEQSRLLVGLGARDCSLS